MPVHSRAPRSLTYPISSPDRAVRYLHQSVVDALGRFRATYRRTPSRAAGQAYTDALAKGRPVGTVTIGRLLLDGRANGACRMAALGVVRALESAVRMIWPAPTPSIEAALLAETEAEGAADLAELRALSSSASIADYDRAIAAQQMELVAEQQLLDALMAARMRAEVGA